MRHRKDANQDTIVKGLVKVGCCVQDMSQVGGGFPDLIVGRAGQTFFIEIKNEDMPPSKRKLRPLQENFKRRWSLAGVPVHVVTTLDEAIAAVWFT